MTVGAGTKFRESLGLWNGRTIFSVEIKSQGRGLKDGALNCRQ
jgi:hypothetical protein